MSEERDALRAEIAREVRNYAKNRAFSKQTAEDIADRILAIVDRQNMSGPSHE